MKGNLRDRNNKRKDLSNVSLKFQKNKREKNRVEALFKGKEAMFFRIVKIKHSLDQRCLRNDRKTHFRSPKKNVFKPAKEK